MVFLIKAANNNLTSRAKLKAKTVSKQENIGCVQQLCGVAQMNTT